MPREEPLEESGTQIFAPRYEFISSSNESRVTVHDRVLLVRDSKTIVTARFHLDNPYVRIYRVLDHRSLYQMRN